MRIKTLKALKDNFIYVLVNGTSCAVIDPGEAAPASQFIADHDLRLTHILCTHHHNDHVGGVRDLLKDFPDSEVWASSYDLPRIPGANLAVAGTRSLWNFEVRVLDMPGHTLGQVAYYFPLIKAVFTGDTLFSAGCGRLFEGTTEQMFSSMEKLRALPAETEIYFGHEYTLNNLKFVKHHGAADPKNAEDFAAKVATRLEKTGSTTPSTIGDEIKINPFLNAKNVVDFAHWRTLRNSW